MATRMIMGFPSDNTPGTSHSVVVREGFDEVLERVHPLSRSPDTTQEIRGQHIYWSPDGYRVLVYPDSVTSIVELADE